MNADVEVFLRVVAWRWKQVVDVGLVERLAVDVHLFVAQLDRVAR